MLPIKRTGLVSQVIDLIGVEIESGRWPVGGRIPTEPELTLLTGTGRNTVREAVQSLVHVGMLERRQGSGTYVMADSLVSGTIRKQVDHAQRQELLELRQALDVTAATLAAARRDDADITQLRSLIASLEDLSELGDIAEFARADAALHRAIVLATHNSLYVEVYQNLIPTMELDIEDEIVSEGSMHLDEHTALVESIVAGDSDGAAHIARQLLDARLSRLR
ncbi:FadR/GntR family transcriptional regulator [Tomitella biformata]|uniref:FadR/GntR family transcriptional regulator n=1 Tax=Tomitella biformata TaxID=630403 RepID=UPI00046473F9|nr:FCD domain-containing protein [Tomitella biformata]